MDTLRFRKTFCLIFNKEQNGHKLADISDKKQKIEIIQQRSRVKCICIMKKVIWNKRKGNKVFSAPVEIRTPNLLIRSQMLYPVELRVQKLDFKYTINAFYFQKRIMTQMKTIIRVAIHNSNKNLCLNSHFALNSRYIKTKIIIKN